MIKGFQKLSLIEYPGKIAAIVFVGKCDFKCHFCYNIDLVENYDKIPDIPERRPDMLLYACILYDRTHVRRWSLSHPG